MNAIRLFKGIQSCQDCLFSWEGLWTGFARGHTVFVRDGSAIFRADDLGVYTEPQMDSIDIEAQLIELGWFRSGTCPKCASRNLFPNEFLEVDEIEVPCICVEEGDLEQNGKLWRLSGLALLKFK